MAQPLEHCARCVGAALGEELRTDHFEQIAADERPLGALDELGVVALGVVAAARLGGALPIETVGSRRGRARQTRGRSAGYSEPVAMQRRLRPPMVDDPALVWPVPDDVAHVTG